MPAALHELGRAVLLQLLLFTALLTPLEILWPARAAQRPIRRGLPTDLAHFALSPVVVTFATALVLSLLGAARRALVPAPIAAALQAQPFALQLVEVVLGSELLAYLVHRAQHRVAWLWRFHAVHHSAEALDWVAAHRAHPVESVLMLAVANLPALALGFSMEPIVGFVLFQKLYTAFLHANLRLDLPGATWLVATPRFHRWHHDGDDRRGRNFAGLLPVFDRLFGTYALPAGEPRHLGTDEPVPPGYLGQLTYPLRRGQGQIAIGADGRLRTSNPATW